MKLDTKQARAFTLAVGGDPDAPRHWATEPEVRKAIEILASCARQLRMGEDAQEEAEICERGAACLRSRLEAERHADRAMAQAVRAYHARPAPSIDVRA